MKCLALFDNAEQCCSKNRAAWQRLVPHHCCKSHNTATSDVSFDSWIQEQSEQSPTFKFWVTLLKLETLLLSFVHSLRETNYDLFKDCLKQMLPWLFLFDHPNYGRWLSVRVSDMEPLPIDSPDVQFCSRGNFVVRKMSRAFLALAVIKHMSNTML